MIAFSGLDDAVLSAFQGKFTPPEVHFGQNLTPNLPVSGRIALICDQNTYEAAGRKIEITTGYHTIILPGTVQADRQTVEELLRLTAGHAGLLAVGSGTINDLCKYASHLQDKPYSVFATALSMNGYASANASVAVENVKHTFAAQLPQHIYMDMDVLSAAPVKLTRAGLGDSVARVSAEWDWRASHLLLGTPFDETPFTIIRETEAELFNDTSGLQDGNINTHYLLAKLLILSGLGMTIAGGSYPASQSEHLVAHYIDQRLPDPPLHGELVGVTTLAMLEKQERFMKKRSIDFIYNDKKYNDHIIKGISESFASVSSNAFFALAQFHTQAEMIRIILQKTGCAITPADLGISNVLWQEALSESRYLRDRFTILDLEAITQ